MPRKMAERTLKKELGLVDLGDVFSDIDLDSPLGSASIAQVNNKDLVHAINFPLVFYASGQHCLQSFFFFNLKILLKNGSYKQSWATIFM